MSDTPLHTSGEPATTSPRHARADAKAEKARAKAMRPWYRKKRWWAVGVVVLIAVGAALGSGGDDEPEATGADDQSTDTASNATQESDSAQESDSYAIGETAPTSGLEVTLHSVTDPFEPSGEFSLTPPDGSRWVAADITVANPGDERVPFSTLVNLELLDADGQAWDITITGENVPSLDGDVLAGQTRRGTAVFELPADAALSHLQIKGSLTAQGARFDL